jgi:hypothetical protein
MMNPVLFSASLSIDSQTIEAKKGKLFADSLVKVAESFKDRFEQLPANIPAISIKQHYTEIPAKGSLWDLTIIGAMWRSMAGGYQSSYIPNETTQVHIKGVGPKGGDHGQTLDLEPQKLDYKQKRFLFFKRTPDTHEIAAFEQKLMAFFERVLQAAQDFSQSSTLLGKKQFEALQATQQKATADAQHKWQKF